MPKLVIVGNGPVGEADHSKLVDAADCVIRFNHCQTYISNQLGSKTNILALRKGHIDVRKKPKLIFPPKVLERAIEFRVYDCWDLSSPEMPDYAKLYPPMAGKLRMLDTTWLLKAREALRDGECDHKYWKAPTIGFIVLLHVLDDPAFADHDIALVGFTWKTVWKKHPQYGEKQLCVAFAEEGKIRLMD